jgi:hypothetical protein
MAEASALFNNITKGSRTHVELGDDAKYELKGDGIVTFQLDLGGSLDAQDIICVP